LGGIEKEKKGREKVTKWVKNIYCKIAEPSKRSPFCLLPAKKSLVYVSGQKDSVAEQRLPVSIHA